MGVIASKYNTGNITTSFKYDPIFTQNVKTIPAINIYILHHSLAPSLLKADYDIKIARENLCRDNVSTTMIYTHILNKRGISVKNLLNG